MGLLIPSIEVVALGCLDRAWSYNTLFVKDMILTFDLAREDVHILPETSARDRHLGLLLHQLIPLDTPQIGRIVSWIIGSIVDRRALRAIHE